MGYPCHVKVSCTICRFGDKSTTLKLRGCCVKEELDLSYHLTNGIRQERYVMRGMVSTELVWNMETLSWNFVNLRSKKVIAYTNDTDDYPLGTHKWTFTDGRCQDNNIVNYRSMNLHSCGDNQFTCKDGQCIDCLLYTSPSPRD